MASEVPPSTSRDSSGPSPPNAVYASSTAVRRLSRGIAARPRLVASRTVFTSMGTRARSCGMTSPSFSLGPSPLRGINCTYSSPTADWLCTSASRSAGIRHVGIERKIGRDTVVGETDTLHDANLRAAIGDVSPRIEPAGFRQLQRDAILPGRP